MLNAIVVWAFICFLFWFICQGFNVECVFSHMVMFSLTLYKCYVDVYTLFWSFWVYYVSGNMIHSCSYLGILRIIVNIFQLGRIHSIMRIEYWNEYSVWWIPEPWTLFIEYLLAFDSDSHPVLKKGLYDYIQSTFYELWVFWKFLAYSTMKP